MRCRSPSMPVRFLPYNAHLSLWRRQHRGALSNIGGHILTRARKINVACGQRRLTRVVNARRAVRYAHAIVAALQFAQQPGSMAAVFGWMS